MRPLSSRRLVIVVYCGVLLLYCDWSYEFISGKLHHRRRHRRRHRRLRRLSLSRGVHGKVWTDITNITDTAKIEGYAEDGMYIFCLSMEGARWDMKRNCIAESFPKDLHPAMPVINVRGVVYDDVDKTGIFECPVYVTTSRGNMFTFISTLRTMEPINKWVLAGVAMVMSDDIA